MSSEWKFSELGKISQNASRPFDFKKHKNVCFVNTGDVLEGFFLHSNITSAIGLPGQAKKAIKKGDILLTEIRPGNGRYAYVDFDAENYVVSTKFMVIQCGDLVDSRFLYHVIKNKAALYEFQRIAESRSGTFPQITFDSIAHFPVPIPPQSEQKNLVNFLDAIDDRITLLRETNTTLEAIAQALFKSWFVDFDPVHAKQQGRAPEGMDAQTAALFPDAFEESELGMVPKGWKNVSVYDMATYINGAAYKAFEPNTEKKGLPIIKIAELKNGVTAQTAYSEVSMPDKYLIRTRDILFSWSGNPDTSIDTFVWIHKQAWLNQHIFRVIPQKNIERSFLLQMLKNLRPTFSELARNKQTTGLGHVTVADMKRLMIAKPDDALLERVDSILGRLHEKIFVNSQHALNLANLRDTLLPRLISGQLRLPEAQALVEDAVDA